MTQEQRTEYLNDIKALEVCNLEDEELNDRERKLCECYNFFYSTYKNFDDQRDRYFNFDIDDTKGDISSININLSIKLESNLSVLIYYFNQDHVSPSIALNSLILIRDSFCKLNDLVNDFNFNKIKQFNEFFINYKLAIKCTKGILKNLCRIYEFYSLAKIDKESKRNKEDYSVENSTQVYLITKNIKKINKYRGNIANFLKVFNQNIAQNVAFIEECNKRNKSTKLLELYNFFNQACCNFKNNKDQYFKSCNDNSQENVFSFEEDLNLVNQICINKNLSSELEDKVTFAVKYFAHYKDNNIFYKLKIIEANLIELNAIGDIVYLQDLKKSNKFFDDYYLAMYDIRSIVENLFCIEQGFDLKDNVINLSLCRSRINNSLGELNKKTRNIKNLEREQSSEVPKLKQDNESSEYKSSHQEVAIPGNLSDSKVFPKGSLPIVYNIK